MSAKREAIHFGNRAWPREGWHEARAQERRLASAARAENEQEWSLRLAQPLHRLPDREVAAEKDALPVRLKRGEARKGRAEALAVPRLTRRDPAIREPLAQAGFDALGEIVRAGVGLERGDELAAGRPEPALEEAFQRVPLFLDVGALRVVERHLRRLRIAKHIDVGRLRLAPLRDGAQNLVGGPGRIGFAIRLALEVVRQG